MTLKPDLSEVKQERRIMMIHEHRIEFHKDSLIMSKFNLIPLTLDLITLRTKFLIEKDKLRYYSHNQD